MNEDGVYGGDLDFSTIYGGLTSGGGDLSSIMESLFSTLGTAGYFGEGYQTGGAQYGQGLEGAGLSVLGDPSFFEQPGMYGNSGYNLENLISFMESSYGEGAPHNPGWDKELGGGLQNMISLLKQIQSKNIAGGYQQDIGGVGAEIGSQTNLLKKGLTTVGKGGRYGALGTGGKFKGGGGRQDYLSQYYGLQQKEREMTTGLQTGVEEDINRTIIDYMGMFPSTT